VDTDHVERVVVAELVLHRHREERHTSSPDLLGL
jgi:hypothetical protein